MPMIITLAKLIFAGLVVAPMYWIIDTLNIGVVLNVGLVLAVFMTIVPAERLPKYSKIAVFAILLGLAFGVPAIHRQSALGYGVTLLALAGLSYLYIQEQILPKLAAMSFSILLSLFLLNIAAGVVLTDLQNEEPFIPPPPDESSDNEAVLEFLPTIVPSLTPNPNASEDTSPPEQPPVPGIGFMDFETDNGSPSWIQYTGTAPRMNSVARAYMYDAEGEIVYDTRIEFNEYGMRGTEASYEKPDDTYRILIIGDSFVEALQVPYEETFFGQLNARLVDSQTLEGKRIEVLAMGRTGWGTLQEYLYYIHEGHKFDADLVMLMFYINDVADNYPRVFYPDRNNVNWEYIFEGDTVQLVDTNQQPLQPNRGRILYDTLPGPLQKMNLMELYIYLQDPPVPVLTPGGVMTQVHPQFYIFVTDPVQDGYPEAWERTEWALRQFAEATAENSSDFVVVPIWVGAELVQNVSSWFPDITDGWQWDDRLPEARLAAILNDTDAEIFSLRPYFEAYAEQADIVVHEGLFLPEDGHFNALGHDLTEQALYQFLVGTERIAE